MSKVHILDEYTINQIAAGEIIESPASIIKELVENSMDAGSSAITVEIKDGGIQYIRVTDNGIGMEPDDAKLALQRHATSKILKAEDLELVSTLGFRGEALASIAAVTQFEMLTRPRDNISGLHIINHGGEFIDISETGCPEGTTIIVRNLFYNTPARQKFLKSTRAESAKISDIMSRLIMCNPSVSIKYINNEKIIYHSPGNGTLMSSIVTVYGSEISHNLIPIEDSSVDADIQINGFLGKPSIARSNRVHQSFFINNRYIGKCDVLTRALEESYKNYITISTYPWAVLHITLPTDQIDVNIHPAKTEVRFKDEGNTYNIIYDIITGSLQRGDYIPSITQKREPTIKEEPIVLTSTILDGGLFKPEESIDVSSYVEGSINTRNYIKDSTNVDSNSDSPTSKEKRNRPISIEEESGNECIDSQITEHNIRQEIFYKLIGTFMSTYILVEMEEALYIIDQHAAHERLLYEKYKEARLNNEIVVQLMHPPLTIDVTHNELTAIEESIDVFSELGFDIEHFGGNTFIIRGVPSFLEKANIQGLFFDILDNIRDGKSRRPYIIDEERIITAACKRAIKARDRLDSREIEALFKELQETDIQQFTCPHGRPIMIKMTQYELERHFKRII